MKWHLTVLLLCSTCVQAEEFFRPTGNYASTQPIFTPTGIYATKEDVNEVRESVEALHGELREMRESVKSIDEALKARVRDSESHATEEKTPQNGPLPARPGRGDKTGKYSEYAPWFEKVNGKLVPTSDRHLIEEHHVSPSTLDGLSQDEKDRLHGMQHGEKPRSGKPLAAVQQLQHFSGSVSSGCPGGQCPINRPMLRIRRR